MSADRTFWLPMPIPLWGIVEARTTQHRISSSPHSTRSAVPRCVVMQSTHLHVNYHHSFVFHADEHGRIMGVATYPGTLAP